MSKFEGGSVVAGHCNVQMPTPSAAAIFNQAKTDTAQLLTLIVMREAKIIAGGLSPAGAKARAY
ncbi:MAG: hypothetical protein EPN33_02325 [Acidobacteria bacterium]|nr:MAG: hypothetical protein EPN33_02325 [Acidobacteriota bacterium]